MPHADLHPVVTDQPSTQPAIQRRARPDPEAPVLITALAQDNALVRLSRLKLPGRQAQLMEFLVGKGGGYTSRQEAMASALNMPVRTLSWAQRRLRDTGLLDLRYTGRNTRYRIRLDGVDSALKALKAASSKGYATGCASISKHIIGKKESENQIVPPAAALSGPHPCGAVQPEGSGEVRLGQEGVSFRARPEQAGTHPDWMLRHEVGRLEREVRRRTTETQRLVSLWQELTGRRATPQEKGILKRLRLDEAEEKLAWWFAHWSGVGEGFLDWADDYPMEPSLPWLLKNIDHYERAYVYKDDLAWRVSTAYERREWRDEQGIEGKRTTEIRKKKDAERVVEQERQLAEVDHLCADLPDEVRRAAHHAVECFCRDAEDAVRQAVISVEFQERNARKARTREAERDDLMRVWTEFRAWAEDHPRSRDIKVEFENCGQRYWHKYVPRREDLPFMDDLRTWADRLRDAIEGGMNERDHRARHALFAEIFGEGDDDDD